MPDKNTHPNDEQTLANYDAENNSTPANATSKTDDNATAQTVAALTAKVAELETNWKRAVADLMNFRRQADADRVSFAKFANEKILVDLLPILDNFQRAATHTPAELAENEWVKGIGAIEAQLEETLTMFGLQKISAQIGDEVDPMKHQMIAIGAGEKNKILEVFEAGYELGGKIIRATKVRVGDGS